MSLNRLELVQFQNDTMVYPKESTFFQEINSNGTLVAINETRFFLEDLVGYQSLFRDKKVTLKVIPDADHLHFNNQHLYLDFIPFVYSKTHSPEV